MLPELSVSEFVALFNQTLEMAYPNVTIIGELANFRVSKGKWIYFDLKDEDAIVRFFGTVYALKSPLEDGMMLKVLGNPRLHPQYGFSITVQTIALYGAGSIKKAASLLEAKLRAEGLFAPERKRFLPYPPERLGLITSSESAAYSDFIKVLGQRWGGVEIELIDVQVQGESAAEQVAAALSSFNAMANSPDIIVITRGGGSAEDLQAFSSELVTRAVATSRIPTLVAIGHERDISLAELAADQRASTPSNAAELLVPSKDRVLEELALTHDNLKRLLAEKIVQTRLELTNQQTNLQQLIEGVYKDARDSLKLSRQLLTVLDPQTPLKRGYALVRNRGRLLRQVVNLKMNDIVEVEMIDGRFKASVKSVKVS
ncbi:MAG TPA: exodeoxyribonuclease VII large subunit [Candidatus Binatia bacterium]|nr:exodeoxyribonuclease VII large subunit [Candidatus Binatia bacterium]